MASRAARAGRRQPNSSNAAHRRPCVIRLAVRLIRGTAPKGAKMFAAIDMTSRCEAQSSWLVPSRTTRHSAGLSQWADLENWLQDHQRNHGELHVAFRNDLSCFEQRNASAQTVEKPHPSARKRHVGSKIRLVGSMGLAHVVKANYEGSIGFLFTKTASKPACRSGWYRRIRARPFALPLGLG